MKKRLRRVKAVLGLVSLFSISFQSLSYAAVSVSIVVAQGSGDSASGSMYNGDLWFKTSNLIKKLTSAGTLTTEYTIPSTINGTSAGTFSTESQADIDVSTGIMYFASGTRPMKLWSIDLNNLSNGATLIFTGLTTCNAYTGGIAVVVPYLYFSCPDAYTVSNNKLYRITIPNSGSVAVSDAGLTVVANSPTVSGFTDLEYRSQDGMLFALMNRGMSTSTNSIVKLNSGGNLPASLTTVKSFTGSYGGISGIDIDDQGDIFFSIYQGGTGVGLYQITDETPTVTTGSVYTLPNSTTDYIYSTGLIVDQGSSSTASTTIAYVVSGWGAIAKIAGASISTFSTVSELVVIATTTTLSIPGGVYVYRQSYTFTAVGTGTGKLSFYVNRKAIAGCKGLPVNAGNSYTATCTYKPSVHGSMSAYVSFTPSGNYLASTSATKYFSVVSRSTKR